MGNISIFQNQPINKARLDHLVSLGLDISGKRVLEVGAGIGLLSHVFLDRECEMVITDANTENIDAIRRLHPTCQVINIDMDHSDSLEYLGRFDIVFCYGLLYHLGDPESALKRLSEICDGQIILETCVNTDEKEKIDFMKDHGGNDSSIHGRACRPSRRWILQKLRNFWGHGYISITQPAHNQFITDWTVPAANLMTRSIFVGSKYPLTLSTLSMDILQKQNTFIGS